MTYCVAYNPALGNALVGVAETFSAPPPEGVVVEQFEGPVPDMSKMFWHEGSLKFLTRDTARWLTPTEFMRKFSMPERLAIRALERNGDLVVVDAMALMAGTKDGVNLDDPDVMLTLQYLASTGVIAPDRIQEILL